MDPEQEPVTGKCIATREVVEVSKKNQFVPLNIECMHCFGIVMNFLGLLRQRTTNWAA